MNNRIEKIALTDRYSMKVNSLRCFKGIDYLTALSFVCQIGDFQRFATAEAFMSYLGLVPGEHSSGDKRRQGGITKSGNPHLRMLVIEAAWYYRYRSSPGKGLKKRRTGQDISIISYADRALHRLQKKFTKLIFRGKSQQVAVTAVSRELSGFIWGMMTNNMA